MKGESLWPRLGGLPLVIEACEYDRLHAVRAFRVVSPSELQTQHWFEIEPADGGTILRHTIDGEAFGEYEGIWRERIEPGH